MEGLYNNLLKYLVDQRRDIFPELTGNEGDYIINNDYLNYFIIFMKSMRYNDDSGIEVNYERLIDELKLFKYYSSGRQNIRKLHMFAVASMAYANEKVKDIDRELVKYCRHFNIPTDDLPELLFFSYLVKASQDLKVVDDIYEDARNSFIKFSYKESFGCSNKANIISFEKKRVELLGKVIAGDYRAYSILTAFKAMVAGNEKDDLTENDKLVAFVKGLLDYLVNIRKGRIETMTYNAEESKLYNERENSIVKHSNFGKCRVVKNIKNKESKTIIVNTRFGCYRLES